MSEHRAEVKVYMSHTDLWRIQQAAQQLGHSLSAYMRWSALTYADAMSIPQNRSLLSRILEGQMALIEGEK